MSHVGDIDRSVAVGVGEYQEFIRYRFRSGEVALNGGSVTDIYVTVKVCVANLQGNKVYFVLRRRRLPPLCLQNRRS